MEHVRVVVRRATPGEVADEVVALQSNAHGLQHHWATEAAVVTDATATVDGLVDFASTDGTVSSAFDADHTHPRIFTQTRGHGPIPCRAIESVPLLGYYGFLSSEIRCPGPSGDPAFLGGDGVILSPIDVATPYDVSHTLGANVGYGLVNVEAALWRWRDLIGAGSMWRDESVFTYVGSRGDPAIAIPEAIGSKFAVDQFINDLGSGVAPWRHAEQGLARGDSFFDPAFSWTQLLTFAHPVDLTYSYNPYLIPAHAVSTSASQL